MSITTSYSWHVCQLNTISSPNDFTVNSIDAHIYAKDSNGIDNTLKFTCKLDVPESYSGDFVDYDNLTESQVAGWITSSLSTSQQQELKDKVSKKLSLYYDNSNNLVGLTTIIKPAVPWTVGFTTT